MATNAKFSYTATGTDTYPITFDFDLATEVTLEVDSVAQTQGVEYNVVGTDVVFTGGNIPANPAAIQGERVTSNTTDNVFGSKSTIDSAAIDEFYLQLLRLSQENAQVSLQDLYDFAGVVPTASIPHIQWNSVTHAYDAVKLDSDDIDEGVTNLFLTEAERLLIASTEAAIATNTANIATNTSDIADNTNALADQVTQVEAESGSSTVSKQWSSERVNQAIQSLSPGGPNGVTAPVGVLTVGKVIEGNGVKSLRETSVDTADLVTASGNIAANSIAIGDGSKGLTDSGVTTTDMVTASANIVSGNIPVGDGSKGLSDSSIASGDLATASAVIVNGNIALGDGSKGLVDSGLTPASIGGLNNVVEDTSPQLGGDLDVKFNKIESTSGDLVLKLPSADGTDAVLITDSADATIASIDSDGNTTLSGGLELPNGNILMKGPASTNEIHPNTADSSDDAVLGLGGGGDAGNSAYLQGGSILLHGNEHANTGDVTISAGAPDGEIDFKINNSSTMRIFKETGGDGLIVDANDEIIASRAPDVILEFQTAASTDGGQAASGGWNLYPINTEVRDINNDVVLAASTWSLPAGEWEAEIYATFHRCNMSQIRLHNTTDDTQLVLGSSVIPRSENNRASSASQNVGVFPIAAGKTMRLEYRVTTTRNGDGLGEPVSWGTNIFGYVRLRRVK